MNTSTISKRTTNTRLGRRRANLNTCLDRTEPSLDLLPVRLHLAMVHPLQGPTKDLTHTVNTALGHRDRIRPTQVRISIHLLLVRLRKVSIHLVSMGPVNTDKWVVYTTGVIIVRYT